MAVRTMIFFLLLLFGAGMFALGAMLSFWLVEPVIRGTEPGAAEAAVQSKLDGLESAFRISRDAWTTERAMYEEALRQAQAETRP
jgi:hypothetical protein